MAGAHASHSSRTSTTNGFAVGEVASPARTARRAGSSPSAGRDRDRYRHETDDECDEEEVDGESSERARWTLLARPCPQDLVRLLGHPFVDDHGDLAAR